MSRAPILAVLALAACLLGAGCASSEPAPAPPEPAPVAPGGLHPVETTAPAGDEGRAALADRFAQRETELKQWKATANQLRSTLEATRDSAEKQRVELQEVRRDLERMTSERDQSHLRELALEKERRELLERLALQQLSEVRREREALEQELRRLESEGEADAQARATPGSEHP